jgi:hypothetical protein
MNKNIAQNPERCCWRHFTVWKLLFSDRVVHNLNQDYTLSVLLENPRVSWNGKEVAVNANFDVRHIDKLLVGARSLVDALRHLKRQAHSFIEKVFNRFEIGAWHDD